MHERNINIFVQKIGIWRQLQS